ncbi:uncharacterized protein Dvar_17420 [Desulfosarcina variabilis str. Montpellier]
MQAVSILSALHSRTAARLSRAVHAYPHAAGQKETMNRIGKKIHNYPLIRKQACHVEKISPPITLFSLLKIYNYPKKNVKKRIQK